MTEQGEKMIIDENKYNYMIGEQKIEWIIKNFSKLETKSGIYLKSKVMIINNCKWNILLYPKGKNTYIKNMYLENTGEWSTDEFEYVSVYLVCLEENIEIKAMYRISIINENIMYSKKNNADFKYNHIDGFAYYAKYEQLKRHIKNDEVHFEIIINITNVKQITNESSIQSIEIYKNIIKNLYKLYKNRESGDVKIIIGDQEIKAHKLILMASSKIFDRMFRIEMEEKKTKIIKIDDIEPHIIEKMLLFFYTGTLDENIYENEEKDIIGQDRDDGTFYLYYKNVFGPENEGEEINIDIKNAILLWMAADKYDVEKLKTICEIYINRKCNIKNNLLVYKFAKKYNLTKILDMCMTYMTYM